MDRWTREDIAGVLGIIATALMLTFGNVFVEVLFRAIGL